MKLGQKKENKNKYFKKGITIIETLIALFIFSVITLSFYSVFTVGSKYILSSKNKIIAIALANERMEFLRNLPYDQVAIVGGLPNGSIDPEENVSVEGKTFRVITDVRYYDDPDDGIFGGSPNDSVSNDYKIAKIMVLWGQETESEKATLSSRFVPPGVENSVGGGTFSINAIDYAGNPVPNVNVNIFNDQVSPNVNYNTQTDINGNLLLQGVPSDNVQNYKITMSKSGYENVVTYSPATAGFIPEDAHSNIIEGVLNEKTMIINLLADLTLRSKDAFGVNIPNVGFSLIGGRRLDDGTVEPGRYSYSQTVTTDGDGEFSVDDVSSGKYVLSAFSVSGGNYQFRKVEIGDDLDSSALNLLSGSNFAADIIFMDRNLDSAYIKVKDSVAGNPILGASVQLRNTILGYDVTLTTDKYGYVYFPENMTTLLQNGEIYDVIVSADNYQSVTTDITISGLTNKEVVITAN